MRGVRLRVLYDEFFAIKSVKFCGIRVEKRAAYYDFGREFPLLAVKSVLASEVGNAAFGGNARAAEKNDVLGFVDEILQGLNLIFHKKIVQNFREIFNTRLTKRSKPQRFSSKTSSVFVQNLKCFRSKPQVFLTKSLTEFNEIPNGFETNSEGAMCVSNMLLQKNLTTPAFSC